MVDAIVRRGKVMIDQTGAKIVAIKLEFQCRLFNFSINEMPAWNTATAVAMIHSIRRHIIRRTQIILDPC